MGAILMKMAALRKGNALRHVENHDMESFPVRKTIIDRFSIRKWAAKCSSRSFPGATDPMLSTQRIPRGRDPVFIYTKNRWGRS